MKTIEIKAYVSGVTDEDFRKRKCFATVMDGDTRRRKEFDLESIRADIVNSIAQRILMDADELIEWDILPGSVFAKITIVPAKDYTPTNQ